MGRTIVGCRSLLDLERNVDYSVDVVHRHKKLIIGYFAVQLDTPKGLHSLWHPLDNGEQL